MSLFVSSLNSGSNGNCYYAGNENEAILIDAGISCKEIEKRMYRQGLNIKKVKAVFISHEHSDHIKGIEVLSKKYDLPIYATELTLRHSGLEIEERLLHNFQLHEEVQIGALTIIPFPKVHDACDPCSFVVSANEIKVGIFTDIGILCKQVIKYFAECNAVFLEANYDATMLENGRYPYFLKQRISGGRGHLSNDQALELFVKHRSASLSHLFLSHLSMNNNCPDIVETLFKKYAGKTQVIVASRKIETPVYAIKSTRVNTPKNTARFSSKQLAFSF